MENRKTILIIEDEDMLLNALRDKLMQEKGIAVLEAKNGKEGLEIALREHPDLILLDIVMPVMDGITMLKKMRVDAWGKNAKVIILTNLSNDEKVIMDLVQGSYDYLIKSDWKIKDLIRTVKKRLEE